jgi:hypothetical protein
VEVEYVDGQVRYERVATLATNVRALGVGSGVSRAVNGSDVGIAEIRRMDARLPADIAEAVEELNQGLHGIDRAPIDRSAAAIAIDVLAPFVIDPLAEKPAVKIARWIEKPSRDDDPPRSCGRSRNDPASIGSGATFTSSRRNAATSRCQTRATIRGCC